MVDPERTEPSLLSRIPNSLIVLLTVAVLLQGPVGAFEALWRYTSSLFETLLGGEELFFEVICQTAPLTFSAAVMAFALRCHLLSLRSIHSLLICAVVLVGSTWLGGQLRTFSAGQRLAQQKADPLHASPTSHAELGYPVALQSNKPTGSTATSRGGGATPLLAQARANVFGASLGTPARSAAFRASSEIGTDVDASVGEGHAGATVFGEGATSLSALSESTTLALEDDATQDAVGRDLVTVEQAVGVLLDFAATSSAPTEPTSAAVVPRVALLPEPDSLIGLLAQAINQTLGYLVYYRPRLFLAALVLGTYLGWSWQPLVDGLLSMMSRKSST